MKRLTCMLLVFAMTATMLTGCGGQSGKEDAAVENAQTQEEKEENPKETESIDQKEKRAKSKEKEPKKSKRHLQKA